MQKINSLFMLELFVDNNSQTKNEFINNNMKTRNQAAKKYINKIIINIPPLSPLSLSIDNSLCSSVSAYIHCIYIRHQTKNNGGKIIKQTVNKYHEPFKKHKQTH